MKKTIKSTLLMGAMVMAGSSFAQIQDEKNVTITMDLQPILQLKMDGPTQLDFTFDEINEYYAGITKYGATVLKVSATVDWDLWAVGLSQGNTVNDGWDNQVAYQAPGAAGVNTIPLNILELHQTPANPATGTACDGANFVLLASDYSAPFQIRDNSAAGLGGIGTGAAANTGSNNCIYTQSPGSEYTQPASTSATGTTEKYIAGATGDNFTTVGCGVVGGSYLMQPSSSGAAAAGFGLSNYYYVIDYRIVPGLPVTFPAGDNTAVRFPSTPVNDAAGSITRGVTAAGTLYSAATTYAAPGVYTMYVKYILAQDL